MYRISNFAQKYQQLKDIDVQSVAMTTQFLLQMKILSTFVSSKFVIVRNNLSVAV
jgi:hypothetical protein